MKIYPDSSFLVSAYLMDAHSPEVIRRMTARPRVLVTPFHCAEVANAMFQQTFRGSVPLLAAQRAFANFQTDCTNGIWVVVGQPERMFRTCEQLALRHSAQLGVRTLDTLHVAAALELKADRFWTFDQRQETLAEAEGLATA